MSITMHFFNNTLHYNALDVNVQLQPETGGPWAASLGQEWSALFKITLVTADVYNS